MESYIHNCLHLRITTLVCLQRGSGTKMYLEDIARAKGEGEKIKIREKRKKKKDLLI